MTRPGTLLAKGFLLQALFNPTGQQRGGLAWIVGRERAAPLDGPFNVNPSLAGYATGLACSARSGEFARYRGSLTAALGALGDRVVWGLLGPLSVIVSLIASTAGVNPAAAALLLVYNPPELCLRWRSARRGILGMQAIAADLAPGGLPRLARLLSRVTALMLGCLAGFWAVGPIRSGRPMEALAGCAGVVIAILLLKRRGGRSGLVAAAGALLLSLLWLAVGNIR